MWALGYTGYGKVTFANDTGVDPGHPAFKLKYRGHFVNAEQSWFEFNSSNTQPFDCSDHGTHTLGTMIGLDRNTNDTIGVAFNALWIGSPILCGIATEDNIAALQWALDPDDNPNTVDDMPDAINNSWHDSSLDSSDCVSIYVSVLDALEASGIAVVFSAGNEGPDPGTITPPHNINTGLVNSFTVGALDGNSPGLEIANFSSIGPSQCGSTGSLLIKPEVSAPGVNVRSAVLDGEYGLKSGTSMAAPHVVGAILLLKEGFPNLTGTELKLALYNTCTDLGTPGEDNTFGMGIIDVFAAYNYLINQGNIPVSPHAVNDVMLYDAEAPIYICDGLVEGINIKVENAGTETLTSFKVDSQISGPSNYSDEFNWSGNLAPGERTSIALPPLPIGAGVHELTIELSQPNGQTDERELNNKYRKRLISFEEFSIDPEVEQINDNLTCEGSSALIRADYSGNGILEWYDSPEGGNLLSSGNEFYTGELNSTTTYYAEIKHQNNTGITAPDPNDLVFTDDYDGGILFDCYNPFVLKSVTVHPQTIGVVLVRLKRRSGTGIAGKTFFFTDLTEQVIDLDFDVPTGDDLVLHINAGVSLPHSIEGVNYPYSVDGVMTIKSSTDEVNPEDNYYYFYNWEIEYYQNCDRIPVVVDVEPSAAPPVAAFDSSVDSLDLEESGLVEFTNNSTGAVQWQWNFGDGNLSSIENPEHTYSEVGTFVVSLTVLNADGCSDTAIKTIKVNETVTDTEDLAFSNDNILLFPVPAKEQLNVQFDFNSTQAIEIRIFDILGREVLFKAKSNYLKNTTILNLSKIEDGIYFIVFQSKEQRIIRKIIKSND